jgi:hypothetical protein
MSTSEEVQKNLDGPSVSKNMLKYHSKSTKESRKRNKPTESSAKSVSSNSDCNTTVDFEASMHLNRGTVEQRESQFSEKNSRGNVGYRKPPYNLGQSISVVQKPQDSRIVKEHFVEGDERNLCKKNESSKFEFIPFLRKNEV